MSVAYDNSLARQIRIAPITSKCSVVVVDSQPVVRAGLVSLIESTLGHVFIAYSGSSIHEAVQAAREIPSTCVILSTRHNELQGKEIDSITAFTMHGIPVLVLVDQPSKESLEAATIAGARGYLGKDADPAQFIQQVRHLTAGKPCDPDGHFFRDSRPTTRAFLSDQERRALVLYTSGLTQDVVARRMGIASSTVKHYLDRVRTKYAEVGVHARTKLELHAIARAEGLLP